MKHYIRILFFSLFIFSFTGLLGQTNDCTQKFSWLNGKWSMKKNGSTIIEQWNFFNGSLKCLSYEVKGIDTTLIENASISCIGGKSVFTYYPEKKDKNGKSLPVHFVLISEDNNVF